MNRQLLLLLILALTLAGCRANQPQPALYGNNGSYNPAYAANNAADPQSNQLAGQIETLNNQVRQYDSDNQNLNAQVAALQQRLQIANSYNDQLKQQLGDQLAQLQQTRVQLQQASALASNANAAGFQNAGFQNPGNGWSTGATATLPPGTSVGDPGTFAGATIRANNGLVQQLQTVQLQGYKAWMDADVIRIEGPTDRIFVAGSYQVNPNDTATLANLANIIRTTFPRQIIGVEAHWDGTAIEPASTSHHQLTATQALAVFDVLVRAGLPPAQIFTMAVGSNRARYPAGNPANRRIEIVIYPETF